MSNSGSRINENEKSEKSEIKLKPLQIRIYNEIEQLKELRNASCKATFQQKDDIGITISQLSAIFGILEFMELSPTTIKLNLK